MRQVTNLIKQDMYQFNACEATPLTRVSDLSIELLLHYF